MQYSCFKNLENSKGIVYFMKSCLINCFIKSIFFKNLFFGNIELLRDVFGFLNVLKNFKGFFRIPMDCCFSYRFKGLKGAPGNNGSPGLPGTRVSV